MIIIALQVVSMVVVFTAAYFDKPAKIENLSTEFTVICLDSYNRYKREASYNNLQEAIEYIEINDDVGRDCYIEEK